MSADRNVHLFVILVSGPTTPRTSAGFDKILVAIAWGLSLQLVVACSSSIGGYADDPEPDAGVAESPDAAPDVVPTPDAAPPQVAPCVEGDTQSSDEEGNCFMLFNTPETWDAAKSACETIGATLVVIDTVDKQELVGVLSGNFPAGEPDLWIGATDVVEETKYVWVSGDDMVLANWRTGMPNNNGGNGTPENCAVLEADTATRGWDDRPCALDFPYLCERAVGILPPP